MEALDQSEASIQVTWSLSTNQRPGKMEALEAGNGQASDQEQEIEKGQISWKPFVIIILYNLDFINNIINIIYYYKRNTHTHSNSNTKS